MKKFFLFLAMAGLTGLASANQAVLKAISGTVFVETASASKPAKEGQFISGKDTVRVGEASVAQVVFANGDAVLVKANSVFRVDQDRQGTLVSFDQGEFLVGLPNKPAKGKVFRVQTPSATLSSSGGAFWGNIDASKKTSCACFSGSLDVLASEKRVSLKANQTMEIAMGSAPSGPTVSKIDPIYVETFAVKGSLQGVDKVIKSKQN